MKIEPRKNEYNHTVVDCPFCEGWAYVRPSTKLSPDPLRDLKRHVTNQAKNEAFAWYLARGSEGDVPTPHLAYYQEHTAMKPVQMGILKRQYDGDMSL